MSVAAARRVSQVGRMRCCCAGGQQAQQQQKQAWQGQLPASRRRIQGIVCCKASTYYRREGLLCALCHPYVVHPPLSGVSCLPLPFCTLTLKNSFSSNSVYSPCPLRAHSCRFFCSLHIS